MDAGWAAKLQAVFELTPTILTVTSLVIDIGLPGVDGYALAQMARETPQARETCLIALTGYGHDEDRQKALASGFDIHLTKPVDPIKLERVLSAR